MEKNELFILWTSGDPVTSENMVLMYATNGLLHSYWDNVTVIIWGASAKLVTENEAIQLKMKIAREAGVRFSACVSCAVNLGIRDKLEALGLEVRPWGGPLTEIIKNDRKLITV